MGTCGELDGVEGMSGQRSVFDAAKAMRAVFCRFIGLIQPGSH